MVSEGTTKEKGKREEGGGCGGGGGGGVGGGYTPLILEKFMKFYGISQDFIEFIEFL